MSFPTPPSLPLTTSTRSIAIKIHHVHETTEDRYVTDPIRGVVKERVSILKPSGMHTMVFGEKTYKIGEDGAFEVPQEVGRFFVSRAGWHEGAGPFPPDESLGDDGDEPVAPQPRHIKTSFGGVIPVSGVKSSREKADQ